MLSIIRRPWLANSGMFVFGETRVKDIKHYSVHVVFPIVPSQASLHFPTEHVQDFGGRVETNPSLLSPTPSLAILFRHLPIMTSPARKPSRKKRIRARGPSGVGIHPGHTGWAMHSNWNRPRPFLLHHDYHAERNITLSIAYSVVSFGTYSHQPRDTIGLQCAG